MSSEEEGQKSPSKEQANSGQEPDEEDKVKSEPFSLQRNGSQESTSSDSETYYKATHRQLPTNDRMDFIKSLGLGQDIPVPRTSYAQSTTSSGSNDSPQITYINREEDEGESKWTPSFQRSSDWSLESTNPTESRGNALVGKNLRMRKGKGTPVTFTLISGSEEARAAAGETPTTETVSLSTALKVVARHLDGDLRSVHDSMVRLSSGRNIETVASMVVRCSLRSGTKSKEDQVFSVETHTESHLN